MFASLRILMGFVFGCGGFLMMGESPVTACSALLLSGFFILSGIDHLGRANVDAD